MSGRDRSGHTAASASCSSARRRWPPSFRPCGLAILALRGPSRRVVARGRRGLTCGATSATCIRATLGGGCMPASAVRRVALPDEGVETLFGSFDENLRQLESVLRVRLKTSGSAVLVEGAAEDVARAERVL